MADQAEIECKNLCDDQWWKTAKISNLKIELDAGVSLMSKDSKGHTSLHSSLMCRNAEIIGELLTAGAGISVSNECNSTILHSTPSLSTVETIKAL